jgi:hypothetical protein
LEAIDNVELLQEVPLKQMRMKRKKIQMEVMMNQMRKKPS